MEIYLFAIFYRARRDDRYKCLLCESTRSTGTLAEHGTRTASTGLDGKGVFSLDQCPAGSISLDWRRDQVDIDFLVWLQQRRKLVSRAAVSHSHIHFPALTLLAMCGTSLCVNDSVMLLANRGHTCSPPSATKLHSESVSLTLTFQAF